MHEERLRVLLAPSPGAAKCAGRGVTLRPDWDEVKLEVMAALLRAKFGRPTYRALLLATGDAPIEEGNTWSDTFWGVCDGQGENHLGRLLMELRAELQDQDRVDAAS